MKELMLKSKEQKGFELYLLDGNFSYFNDRNLDENEMDFDNEAYAYALFKILNKANSLGAFDNIKPDPDVSDEDIETIYT